ncbi:hypothetical protein WA577_007268 [Blastocystis sp. JDR]
MAKKSYQEVVRGIRTAKDPAMYISEVLTEIRQEIKGTDRNDKVISLQKLIYLNLLGYNFDWAEFHVIEVMSQPLYKERRVGYLAATVLIRPESELFILCANTLKKAFLSKNKYDVGLALDCFSMVVTEELARDLLPDILNLLKSKRAFVRRKAVLCLFRIYRQYPASLDEFYTPLVSMLGDADISVQSSAISVITELAREDPSRYQQLAPTIFNLLVNVENTWILIKVVKLLMNLVTQEPRLAKKILDPLVTIVRQAETKSLLYEAMMGVGQCLIYVPIKEGSKFAREVGKVAELLMAKFLEFVEDPDPNLKYLGLCGLLRLVKTAPAVVAKKSYIYVNCLKANDSTIRSKALSLIQEIANPKNLKNLVEDLVTCLHSGTEYEMREDIINGILDMCSRDMYKNTQDFAWLVSVLVDLAKTRGSHTGEAISQRLIDITLRVPAVRLITVNYVLPLLLQPDSVCESMKCYSGYLQQDQIANVFASLASPSVMYLDPAIQATMLQSLLQVTLRFICSLGSGSDQAVVIKRSVVAHAAQFLSSQSDEVRYRASLLIEVLNATAAFDNETIAIEQREDVKQEMERMEEERKALTTLNEKKEEPAEKETTPESSDSELNLASALETQEAKEEAKEETPKEETPKEEVKEEAAQLGIHHLSELLSRLTEELLPVSAKAQKKVKVPEGLNLDEPLASLALDKEVEPVRSIEFNDGPLFVYASEKKEESGRRHHKGKHGHRREKKDLDQFYLGGKDDDEEGEVKELTLEDVGVPVVEGKEEEAPAVKFEVIRDEEESEEEKKETKSVAEGEKKHRHRSHRHREEKESAKEDSVKDDASVKERKHRHHHH